MCTLANVRLSLRPHILVSAPQKDCEERHASTIVPGVEDYSQVQGEVVQSNVVVSSSMPRRLNPQVASACAAGGVGGGTGT